LRRIHVPSVQAGFHIFWLPYTEYLLVHWSTGDSIAWDGNDNYFLIKGDAGNWSGHVCGVCGNMNGDASDDLIPKGKGEGV